VSEGQTTLDVQRCLDELADVSGDASVEPLVRSLVARAADRLQTLCSVLLHSHYPRLTHGPLNLCSDEVLGGVVERLLKALRAVHPATVREFFGLANQHMRWELNDLARRLDAGARVVSLNESVFAAPILPEATQRPTVSFQRILQAIDSLADPEREVFNLVRIQGMTQVEAAKVIGVSAKTVQRRLTRGLVQLEEWLSDFRPRSGALEAR